MCRRTGDRRWRSLRLIGAAIYALFLVVAPFEHHDLLCELKTPQHCTSCASSQIGSDPNIPALFDSSHLTDAGSAASTLIVGHGTLLPVRTTGRSPPTIS